MGSQHREVAYYVAAGHSHVLWKSTQSATQLAFWQNKSAGSGQEQNASERNAAIYGRSENDRLHRVAIADAHSELMISPTAATP
jgi:hypothetical protein